MNHQFTSLIIDVRHVIHFYILFLLLMSVDVLKLFKFISQRIIFAEYSLVQYIFIVAKMSYCPKYTLYIEGK